MNYDVVIPTRNRPDALKVSVPLILHQELPPQKLIVVDASEDHEQVRRTVIETVADSPVEVEILLSQPNSSRQRNIGLELVISPVVLFPDDDSLWWPGVGDAIMQVYEHDTAHDIGGVCACPADAKRPPPGTPLAIDGSKMRLSDRLRQRVAGLRYRFDSRVCPNPLHLHGRSRWNVLPAPRWLSEVNATPTEFMTGLCMSFRTELIRPHGFDEDLGAYVGWAAWEDAACSFEMMRKRLVVEAHDAKVYHYKFPGVRSSGFEAGFINWFNCAYVICRYAPLGSPARCALKRYGIYKLMQYMLGAHTQFGRERVQGHLMAIRLMGELLNTPVDCLRQRYLELCQKALGRR